MPWLAVGAAAMLLGVVAGAFGAHSLASQLDARSLQTFETAVRYHLIHGLGLLAVGAIAGGSLGWFAGALMTAGIVLFSGSLYGLALGGPSWLGPVTPLGGLCLIAAWGCLFVAVLRQA